MRSNLSPIQSQVPPPPSLPEPAVTPPDMAPWLVALLRATGQAALSGAGAFVLLASHTHDPWTLGLAVAAAVLTSFGWRGVAEGAADTARAEHAAAKAERAAK